MSHENEDTSALHYHGSYKSYIWGFVLSIVLTFLAYFAVVRESFSYIYLVTFILVLGVVQMFIQLQLFLHMANEPKPRYNLVIFLFMMMVLLIIVLGSLWIMYDLNKRVMPTEKEMEAYMLKQGGMPKHDTKK
jgi:cytochrome o ubiquinol oxidase operon protein cyoD